MSEIERIIKCCNYDNELFRTYINCLIQLKKCSETFLQIQIQLRNDYLTYYPKEVSFLRHVKDDSLAAGGR
ncbi:hypothetical protein ABH961_003251 [Bacillus sp. RC251]|nr:Protein of unknown function [Bacillus wiedmannii]